MIAFKIFRDSDGESDFGVMSSLQERCKSVAEKMQPPYGVLMDQQYCIGTSKLSGFNLLLLAGVRIMSPR